MKQATGETKMTVIVIVLIGLVAAAGAILIPRITSNTIYTSCCNQAEGKWSNGYCTAKTPTTCEARENVWKEYNSCVIENDKHNANEKYKTVECN
jgi:hypothetical protein